MPLYEYECQAKGHRTEIIQRISDPPLEKCPQCGSPVEKLLSAPAFQFKGSGWYVTDYARKGGAAGGEKAEKAEKGGEGKGGSAKPEAGGKSGGDSSTAANTSKPKAAAE